MKYRDYYLNALTPLYEISKDAATAAFTFNEEWLFEIREGLSVLEEKTRNVEYSLHSEYRALLSIVTELHRGARRHNLQMAQI